MINKEYSVKNIVTYNEILDLWSTGYLTCLTRILTIESRGESALQMVRFLLFVIK